MKKKTKILIITISTIVGLVGLFVLLSFTAFSLKEVTVDIRTSLDERFVATQEEIIESGGFSYGSPVFFQSKKKYKERIENKYPYIKVINMEIVFPSQLIIHIAERQEVYAIEGQKYYICDEDLKVLRIEDEFISENNNAILVSGVEIKNESVKVCDTLKLKNFKDLYSLLYGYNRPLGEQQSLIERVDFAKELDEKINIVELNANIKMFNGQVYKIKNVEYGLKYKCKLFLDVYSQIYTFIGKELEISGEEGKTIILTKANLDKATIIVSSYYDFTQYGEQDCCFIILPNID